MANVGGEEYGPFTWDQMLQMAAEGRVTPELPIRKVSDSQWSTAAAIPGLLGGAKPAAQKAAAPSAAAPAAKSAIKKAKPLARPPVSRPAPPVVNAPQNIPVGVPAGIPVGAPVGVAVGSPASSSSGAFNFDLNAAPSGKQRTVKKSVLDDEDSPAIKKKGNTPLLIGALGGGAALVAIIVGITVYITMFRGGKEEKVVATNTSTETEGTDEEGAESNPGETNPEGEADSGSKKAAAAKTKAAKGTKATTPDAKSPPKSDQKAIVEGIREWKNIVTLKSVGIGNARVAISRVWLAADATGKRADVSAVAAEKPAEAAPAAEEGKKGDAPVEGATAASGKAKFVFVEIAISNKAGAPIKYKGWNNPGVGAAILADDQNNIFPLVPKTETSGVQRLGAADVPGGGGITETLVFEAPSGSFDALHLVLPQVVFYPSMKGKQFALEITPDVLANEGGPPVAVPPAGLAGTEGNDPLVPGRKVATEPGKVEGITPAEPSKPEASAATKTPEPPPPKKPSLIDEINKDFEGKEKMDEGKGAAPAKKGAPPKAADPENPFQPVKPKNKKK